MVWKDRIEVHSSVMGGKPVVKGTRLTVEFVVGLLGNGWTIEQVLQEYDHITREDVQACLAYAAEVLRGGKVYPTPSVA